MTREIKGYVADFREFLQEGTFPERNALIRNFVQGIEIVEDKAVLTYTIPMPSDRVTSESASVIDFAQSGSPSERPVASIPVLITGLQYAPEAGTMVVSVEWAQEPDLPVGGCSAV